MKILVADDERISRLTLELILVEWGHQVVAVADGAAAWQELQRSDAPRLAILDWEMPGLSGIDVCRKVRSAALNPPPYLLVLTGRDGKEHIATALKAGANDYLTKPFNPDELRVRLDVGISLQELQNLEITSRELERRVQERTTELATAHANNERLLQAISSVLIVLDGAGRITRWNRSAEEVFGLTAGQVLGQAFTAINIPWTDPNLPEQIYSCGRANCQTQLDNVPFSRADGSHGYLDLCITPILEQQQDQPLGMLLLGEDRTEQRQLERQLSQAQKLESIGQLAAGIAHEINTPIQYVGDNIRFLQDAFADIIGVLQHGQSLHHAVQAATGSTDETLASLVRAIEGADLDFLIDEVPRAVGQSLDGLDRVANIVRAMKEFSHPGGDEKVPTDINRCIETTVTVARNEWKYVAELVCNLDPDLPTVPCRPGEFNQVLLNLIVNAAHAIDEKLGKQTTDKGMITVRTRRLANGIEIQVEDTGAGIPPEIRSRLFDPFFTTKPVGKGTGQGLTLAHNYVVGKLGGVITFESEVGKGTTFIVRLPLDDKQLLDLRRSSSIFMRRPDDTNPVCGR